MSSEAKEFLNDIQLQLPDTKPKQFVFVLMPFSSEFTDTYELGIKAACQAAGAYSERVDEQIFDGSILDRVFHQIATADLIVADMSGRNPNVFYEVGYAHALGKRVILLTRSADDIPFDLKHYQHIVYGESITTLRDNLFPALRHYLDEPNAEPADPFESIEFYVNLEPQQRSAVLTKPDSSTKAEASVLGRNKSRHVVDITTPLSLTLVPLRGNRLSKVNDDMIVDPDGKGIWMLPPIGRMYPDQWWSATVHFAVIARETSRGVGSFLADLTHHSPIGIQHLHFKLFAR